ncbi:MAG: hypothetical protein AAGL68_10440, partial [Pseudomonadota bacterium]
DLSDGSRVVVRVPDMCRRNRAFVKAADGDMEKRRGWKETGSFDVMPLVIWSERSSDPERVESYISRDYYNHPEARFTNAKGTLTLWEVGRVPEDVRGILAAPPFEPITPNPWINPERAKSLSESERLKGHGRDGKYHGNGPRYAAYTITEIDSVEEWWEKHQEYSARAEFLSLRKAGKPEPDPRFETDEVSVWPQAADLDSDDTGDPSFVSGDCPGRYINDLMLGIPRMSGLPFNSQDVPIIISGISIDEDGPYKPDYKKKDYQLMAMQWRACAKRAAQTRTFDIVDGRLDASEAIPGVIVYRKWGVLMGDGIPTPPVLTNAGVIVTDEPRGLALSLSGIPARTSGFFHGDGVAHLKKTDQWYAFGTHRNLYAGRLEGSKF